MRSIIMFLEGTPQMPEEEEPLPFPPPKPVPITNRLSPYLTNYMKKDPDFAAQVTANIKNYENIAKMRARHLIR